MSFQFATQSPAFLLSPEQAAENVNEFVERDRVAQGASSAAANALGVARPQRIAGLGRSLLDDRALEALALRRGLRRSALGPGLFFDPNDPKQLARETKAVPIRFGGPKGTTLQNRSEPDTFLTGAIPKRRLRTAAGIDVPQGKDGFGGATRSEFFLASSGFG